MLELDCGDFMKKILFVCHGNICRSPMGEYILKYLVNDNYVIESRATSVEEIGNDIYPPVKEVLNKYNIPYKKHKARQISVDDYNTFDLIICFDDYNLDGVRRITNDLSKVRKLLSKDIEDPWYTGNYEKVFHEIYEGCSLLIDEIKY